MAESTQSLVAAVLDEDRSRDETDVVYPDELLPGARDDDVGLRDGLKRSGTYTFAILLILNSLDELESATMTVLAPDLRDAFNVSDGAIVFISSASAAFFVLGAVPMGYLADRYRRARIVGFSSLVFSVMVFLSGFAVSAFMLFWTRFGAGIAKANTLTVHGSLLADTYPISLRGRIAAAISIVGRSVQAISPLLVGGIAIVFGWRWPFLLLGLPVAVVAVLAFRMKEPPRGQWEKKAVLGEVIEDADAAPISMEAAFARLMRIRTLRTVVIGFAALGFSLFTVPVLASLFMEEEFGLNALERGVVTSIAGFVGIFILPWLGRHFDRSYRRDPSESLRMIGRFIVPMAIVSPLQFLMPEPISFTVLEVIRNLLAVAAFSMVTPLIQHVTPYRLRGLGLALVTLYIFLIGAIGGSVTSAWLTNEYSTTVAVFVLAIPANLIGGAMIFRSARYIRADLSLAVAELQEEMVEHRRRIDHPDDGPGRAGGRHRLLLRRRADPVRSLLRGAQGRGAGAARYERCGQVDHPQGDHRARHPRTRRRAPQWPDDHLHLARSSEPGSASRCCPAAPACSGRSRSATTCSSAPTATDAMPLTSSAGSTTCSSCSRHSPRGATCGPVDLSGGQQQMLALGRVMLHEPELLVIDELSLGLAPSVVQQLIAMIEQLKAAGQTMIIVEQSLNVAVAVADRAVFLEKGRVRFEGPARDLLERDDLARAVFLGAEGG